MRESALRVLQHYPLAGLIDRLATRPARIPSKVVLGGDSEVVIVHGKDDNPAVVTTSTKGGGEEAAAATPAA